MFSGIYRGKKVLITGDTGFKGSWLAIWLKSLGAEVYGYALPPKRTEDNFARCGLQKWIHHRDGDVREGNALAEYFQSVQPDMAFHLAAQALVREGYRDAVGTFETNVMGAVHFLEAVRQTASVRVAINVTSDKCYDNREWVWGYRESDPMGGADPYSASKGAAELITAAYTRSFFMPHMPTSLCSVATARAGNVIGGGDWAEDRIVPDFFRALRDDQPLVLRHPHAIRPWQFVLEPLRGYLRLGERLFLEGSSYNGAWNFGPAPGRTCTVLELADALRSRMGRGRIEVVHPSGTEHEAHMLSLDISKAVSRLSWSPVLTMEETIEMTARGYSDDQSPSVLDARLKQLEQYIERFATVDRRGP